MRVDQPPQRHGLLQRRQGQAGRCCQTTSQPQHTSMPLQPAAPYMMGARLPAASGQSTVVDQIGNNHIPCGRMHLTASCAAAGSLGRAAAPSISPSINQSSLNQSINTSMKYLGSFRLLSRSNIFTATLVTPLSLARYTSPLHGGQGKPGVTRIYQQRLGGTGSASRVRQTPAGGRQGKLAGSMIGMTVQGAVNKLLYCMLGNA